VDGNQTQIEAIKAEASRRKVTVHIVIDFIHVRMSTSSGPTVMV